MFGDVLSKQQCEFIVANLRNCALPFQWYILFFIFPHHIVLMDVPPLFHFTCSKFDKQQCAFSLWLSFFVFFLQQHNAFSMSKHVQIPKPKTYVSLPQGKVKYHYERSNETSHNRLVVLVHGMGAYSYYFKPLAKHLVAQGYSTLRFDLFGRYVVMFF